MYILSNNNKLWGIDYSPESFNITSIDEITIKLLSFLKKIIIYNVYDFSENIFSKILNHTLKVFMGII